jgi:hypothetical protein
MHSALVRATQLLQAERGMPKMLEPSLPFHLRNMEHELYTPGILLEFEPPLQKLIEGFSTFCTFTVGSYSIFIRLNAESHAGPHTRG